MCVADCGQYRLADPRCPDNNYIVRLRDLREAVLRTDVNQSRPWMHDIRIDALQLLDELAVAVEVRAPGLQRGSTRPSTLIDQLPVPVNSVSAAQALAPPGQLAAPAPLSRDTINPILGSVLSTSTSTSSTAGARPTAGRLGGNPPESLVSSSAVAASAQGKLDSESQQPRRQRYRPIAASSNPRGSWFTLWLHSTNLSDFSEMDPEMAGSRVAKRMIKVVPFVKLFTRRASDGTANALIVVLEMYARQCASAVQGWKSL